MTPQQPEREIEREATKWAPIDIATPARWHRSKAWRWGQSRWIVAAALSPKSFAIGFELMTGYGKGLALYLGPFWIGIAANYAAGDHLNQGSPNHD